MATESVRHTGWNDWNAHTLGETVTAPNGGESCYRFSSPGGTIVNHPQGISGQKAFQPPNMLGVLGIGLTLTGAGFPENDVSGIQLAVRVAGPPQGTAMTAFYLDIVGYAIDPNLGPVEVNRHSTGLQVQAGGSTSASGAYLSGNIKMIQLEPRNPPANAQWWLTYAGVPGAPINGPLFKVDWWELVPVSTVLHPTRQHPRSDGLGASSARRRFPASGSVQASARRFGTYT